MDLNRNATIKTATWNTFLYFYFIIRIQFLFTNHNQRHGKRE